MKKLFFALTFLFTASAMAQNPFGGGGPSMGAPPLPMMSDSGGGGNFMQPNPMMPPGSFVQPQQPSYGEQSAYSQVGAQNCQPRGYNGPITGPIQPNGMPAQIPNNVPIHY
jgi:hypothetical protein